MTTIRAPLRLDHFQPHAAKPTTAPSSASATSSMPSSSGVAMSARAISSSPASVGFDS